MRRGLIGYPLGHSFSKIIHESINGKEYEVMPLKEDELDAFMKAKEFDAINVTIPYKEKVIPYLDYLSDEAKAIGAVNCIVNKDGKLFGYNSDALGFKQMLLTNNFDLNGLNVAILGTGGASKAVNVIVKELNAKEIYLVSREKKNNEITYDELYTIENKIDVIINTTPVGMFPKDEAMPIDLEKFTSLKYLIDIIYNPLNTLLVAKAKFKGIKSIGGIEMLVYQAIKAVEIFDDTHIDEKVTKKVLHHIVDEKRNIVLIGMPSAGKSTIAKMIAEKYQYDLIEIDELIEQRINMSIKDYFEKNGENEFRKVESEIVKELRNNHHCVISCGGGVIKDSANMAYLQENGLILFIERDVDKLISTDDRPLSSSNEAIKKLYDERIAYYNLYADHIIKNNDDIKETIHEIERVIGE